MTTTGRSYGAGTAAVRLALLAGGLFVVGTNAFVIAGVLPAIAGDLGASQTAVASSITWYAGVVAVVSPLVPLLLPRLSRTVLMASGLVLVAAGTVVASLAPDLTVFVVGRVVAALGGAALVPTATAAAPTVLPPERRGRAIAAVTLGFTLATAVGSPGGTALAAAVGWRGTMQLLAGLALLLALALALGVRDIPLAPPATVAQRLGLLRDPRLVLVLVATVLLTTGFNVVYVFSAELAHPATGGDARLLAVLLLGYGVGGVVGTALAGVVTDRAGTRISASTTVGAEIVVFVLIAVAERSFAGLAVLYVVWGLVAFGAVVPLQQRLVETDPARAGLALGWYSTAMYVGIALAPPLGAVALSTGPTGLPVAGAVVTALSLAAFLLGSRARRPVTAA